MDDDEDLLQQKLRAAEQRTEAARQELKFQSERVEAAKQEATVYREQAEAARQEAAKVHHRCERTAEQEAKVHREQAAEAEKQEARAVREHTDAIQQETRAIRELTEAFEQEANVHRERTAAFVQEAKVYREQREAFEQEAKVHREQMKALKQLNEGTYYSTLERVWNRIPMAYTREHFDALFRDKPPNGYKYDETVREAKLVSNIVADSEKTASETVGSDINDKVFPTDIFDVNDHLAHVAHLIPASTIQASMYDDVAAWALGLTKGLEPEDLAIKQKAIHGSKETSSEGQRIQFTGLKHSQSNKMRLLRVVEYIHMCPCVVIVPIMNLEEMKCWYDGVGVTYDAVVLAEAWKTDGCDIFIRNVCQSVRMCYEPEENEIATVEDIEKAGKLLEQVLCGLAFSLLQRDRTFPRSETTELFNALRNQFTHRNQFTTGNGNITVPALNGNGVNLRVRKVTFGRTGLHPMPDPLLLTVQAAVTWSTRYGQQLLAGEEVPDDGSDSASLTRSTRYGQQMLADVVVDPDLYRLKEFDDLDVCLGQSQGDCSDMSMDSGLVNED